MRALRRDCQARGTPDMDEITARHNEKMRRIKAARDEMMKTKTE
jgi:hypothetical protein